ncbi:MAG TPA: hypothetical protein VGN16_19015 [Acidobacteriaceae bacterium]|jgi:hypothetical protein
MQAAYRNTLRHVVRTTAALVAYSFLFNQLAHAAKLPHRLAVLQNIAASTTPANLPLLKERLAAPDATEPSATDTTAMQQPLPLGASSPEVAVRNRLQAAQKIFVMNDGTDANYPLSQTAGIDRFIATLQAWGRYKLVDNAADADLVFQFRNVTYTSVQDGTPHSPSATVTYEPEFRLVIADPQTLKPMWSFVLPVNTGTSHGTDLFAMSVGNVTSQVKLLAGETLTPAENTALYPPMSGGHHLGWILGGFFIAALIAMPIVLTRHAQDSQHDFCVAHGLSC